MEYDREYDTFCSHVMGGWQDVMFLGGERKSPAKSESVGRLPTSTVTPLL